MNDILLLYLFTRIDAIKVTVGILTFMIPIIYFIACGHASIVCNRDRHVGYIKTTITIWFFCFFGYVLIPTQKDVMLIVGGKLAIDIAQAPETKETAGKLYQLLQKKLDAELKDTTVNKPQEPTK